MLLLILLGWLLGEVFTNHENASQSRKSVGTESKDACTRLRMVALSTGMVKRFKALHTNFFFLPELMRKRIPLKTDWHSDIDWIV
jgi:hypothetical protein